MLEEELGDSGAGEGVDEAEELVVGQGIADSVVVHLHVRQEVEQGWLLGKR